METTEQNIEEAKAAMAAYFESQRRARSQTTGAVFYSPAISFDTANEERSQGARNEYIEQSKRDAEEFCRARNERLRPIRRKSNETQEEQEARERAIRYIEAKRRSVIRR